MSQAKKWKEEGRTWRAYETPKGAKTASVVIEKSTGKTVVYWSKKSTHL